MGYSELVQEIKCIRSEVKRLHARQVVCSWLVVGRQLHVKLEVVDL
jgi:hypothetical protein